MKKLRNNWTAEDQEHYEYLRSRRIGTVKAKRMAREMTNIDRRGERQEKERRHR